MLPLRSTVMVRDPSSKYFGQTGEIVGVQFGLVTDIYTIDIKLSFRSVLEDFEEGQLETVGASSGRMFKVGDRVSVSAKGRMERSGTVTRVDPDDTIVYIKPDDREEIIWYFEKELVVNNSP